MPAPDAARAHVAVFSLGGLEQAAAWGKDITHRLTPKPPGPTRLNSPT
jgi:hypothetical protein